MWDHLRLVGRNLISVRIIPTYVGSPDPACRSSYLSPNHSHVCGITRPVEIRRSPLYESFPRMWDHPGPCSFARPRFRIIPTYVGSPTSAPPPSPRTPNHSHVCGITVYSASAASRFVESFPRMWDHRASWHSRNLEFRIIPTYVGSPLQMAFTLHQAIQHLVVLCYWRMVYDFLDPQYVLALNSS